MVDIQRLFDLCITQWGKPAEDNGLHASRPGALNNLVANPSSSLAPVWGRDALCWGPHKTQRVPRSVQCNARLHGLPAVAPGQRNTPCCTRTRTAGKSYCPGPAAMQKPLACANAACSLQTHHPLQLHAPDLVISTTKIFMVCICRRRILAKIGLGFEFHREAGQFGCPKFTFPSFQLI